MHMGTQYGLLTRIMATLACVGLLTSIATAAIMWWKRRPSGGTGLPDRSSETGRAATPRGAAIAVAGAATTLAVVYPAFGASLIVVLAAETMIAVRRRSRTIMKP